MLSNGAAHSILDDDQWMCWTCPTRGRHVIRTDHLLPDILLDMFNNSSTSPLSLDGKLRWMIGMDGKRFQKVESVNGTEVERVG